MRVALILAAFWCLGPGARAGGQNSASPVRAVSPVAGSLMLCGEENVVTLPGTASEDGRYALAWTLHPSDPGQKPVDWSIFRPDAPEAFLRRFPPVGDAGHAGYLVFDGVVNVSAHTFTPLPFVDPDTDPFYPGKPGGNLSAAWSQEDRDGRRHALACNNLTRIGDGENAVSSVTLELWLFEATPHASRVANLKTTADVVMQGFVQRRDLRHPDKYRWSYLLDDSGVFDGLNARVHFSAGLPGDAHRQYAGYINFKLPEGRAAGVTWQP